MSLRAEFDRWAEAGRDKGMERRHWHTAKEVLARMPVEPSDVVLDLGTGSGYVLRALRGTERIDRGYGLDASPKMLANARSYTDDRQIGFLRGDFDSLPMPSNTVDHVVSMEAFYYAGDPARTLREIARILTPGGTFYCAVNFFEESETTHEWAENVDVEMTLWSGRQYRDAFRAAGLHVAEQDRIPDREIDIPDEDAFPTDGFETRQEMVDRFRTWGTLLTVGVAPS